MMRLCLLALVALSVFSDSSEGSAIRVERDACEAVHAEFDTCNANAYEEYKEKFTAGDDGRPDWMARKTCNYMTASVEDCGNAMIGDCFTEEEVNEMKDGQFEGILGQLEMSIEEWDSDKCPAVKAYADRVSGDTEEEETEEEAVEVESGAQEEETADETDGEEGVDDGADETEGEEGADDGADDTDGEEGGDGDNEDDEADDGVEETDGEVGEDGEGGEDGEDAEDAEDAEDGEDEEDEEDDESDTADEPEAGAVSTTASLTMLIAFALASYAQ